MYNCKQEIINKAYLKLNLSYYYANNNFIYKNHIKLLILSLIIFCPGLRGLTNLLAPSLHQKLKFCAFSYNL